MLVGFGTQVLAEPITFNFGGVYESNVPDSLALFPTGTPFSGTLTYDSAQTGVLTFSGGGSWTQTEFTFDSLTLTIEGQTITAGPDHLVVDNDVDYGVPGAKLDAFATAVSPISGKLNGVDVYYLSFGLYDLSGTVFSGPELPTNLDLTSFSQSGVGLNYGDRGGDVLFLESLTLASPAAGVPEHCSSVGLFGCTLLALAAAMRFREVWKQPFLDCSKRRDTHRYA
jgi:hypothetical protein